MKILFWVAPWIAQGDLLFFKNCFVKHLIPQANTLASGGCDVSVVVCELFSDLDSRLDESINRIHLDLRDAFEMTGGSSDPSRALYEGQRIEVQNNIQHVLFKKLDQSYDVILLWETPVPFLSAMYPDALIVHQMPGAFSRSPYPHTVTFDPIGLYKEGSIFRHADEILKSTPTSAQLEITKEFSSVARGAIASLQPFTREMFDPKHRFEKINLLPLQVSSHYAFQADTPFSSQAEFLVDALKRTPENTGLIVTQYITPRVQDRALTPDVLNAVRRKWPNLIYREEFDTINSISQYLIPFADAIYTASSSIAIQGFAWERILIVPCETFLKPYETQKIQELGHAPAHAYENALSVLLNRLQPLATRVVDDKHFLISLLEDMLSRKRAGKQGLDLLPSFVDIDKNYGSDLLGSFNIERAAKDISRLSSKTHAQLEEAKKFRRVASDSSVHYISFDVFDTLINRPVETPADVYKFLEGLAVKLTNGLTEDFARIRLIAETETRERSEAGEITLDQIYQYIQEHYHLSLDVVEELKILEIETEIDFIQVRPAGKKLWDIAKSTGKPIVVISDMYLPTSVVLRMLEKAGYSGFSKIYVSSKYLARKKEGALFDVVLSDLGCEAEKVLHVGDNKVADIEQPAAKGMKTFRLLRAIDRMRGNDIYKDLFNPRSGSGEKSRSVIAGLISHRLFDMPSGDHEKASLFMADRFNLGYAGLGPVIAAFMLWLGRRAKCDGVTKLYFLSREGWILKQVYDAIHSGNTNAVPSAYLYSSRRAARVACLKTVADVLGVASQPFRAGVEVGQLVADRFGLASDHIDQATLTSAGYASINEQVKSDSAGRAQFGKLCMLLADEILIHAATERVPYLEYLHQTGLMSEPIPAIVDVGWKGNMQGALAHLVGKNLQGYYYATLQGAEMWTQRGQRMHAFVGEGISQNHPSTLLNNRHLSEFLTCHVEPSLARIGRQQDSLVPVFREEASLNERRMLIEEVHRGVFLFAVDMQKRFGGMLDQIYIDWSLAERVFSSFVAQPSAADASLLVGQCFEDLFGGVKKEYLVAPTAKGSSVWKAGAEIFYFKPEPQKPEAIIKKTSKATAVLKVAGNDETSETKPILRRLEQSIISRMLSQRKFQKYQRDREQFFADAKSPLAKYWIKVTQQAGE
jgi:HAD superfamily hydrolase (TIGR01549 family)